LVNAFEQPIDPKRGAPAAAQAMKEHHQALKKTWGIVTGCESEMPGKALEEFCTELVKYVI